MNISKKSVLVNLLIISLILTMMPSMAFAQTNEDVNVSADGSNNAIIENVSGGAFDDESQIPNEESDKNNIEQSSGSEPAPDPINSLPQEGTDKKAAKKDKTKSQSEESETTVDVATYEDLVREASVINTDGDIIINVTEDIEITSTLHFGGTGTYKKIIKSTGNKTLTRANENIRELIRVGPSNIVLEDITLDGGGDANSSTLNGLAMITTGTLTMESGTVIENAKLTSGNRGTAVEINGTGKFVMNDGLIQNNEGKNSGAIYAIAGGSFEMNGGTIRNNVAREGEGGAVSALNVTINDGKIINNRAMKIGGGIRTSNLIMTGGQITGNSANTSGGGIWVKNGQITGGQISQNDAQFGGGIYIDDGNTEISEVKMSDNRASQHGNGIYISKDKSASNSLLKLKGAPEITDGIYSNWHLVSSINISDNLTGNVPIQIEGTAYTQEMNSGGNFVTKTGASSTVLDKEAKLFVSADETLVGTPNGDKVKWVSSGKEVYKISNLEGLKAALSETNRTSGVIIELIGDIEVNEIVNVTGKLNTPFVLQSSQNKKIIRMAGYKGNILNVKSGAKFNIKNLTIDGNGTDTNCSSLINLEPGGNLSIDSGTRLQNNIATDNGGAISNKGILSINGGQISHNSAKFGGGVYNSGNGSLIINGGRITQNEGTGFGGGIRAEGTSTAIMYDGVINSNTSNDYGGGLHLNDSATFQMAGGTIDNNNAAGQGGGVFAIGTSQFTLDNGSISNNKAGSDGGGVCHASENPFEMNGGFINGNTSEKKGGGIASRCEIDSEKLNINGGSIKGNNAKTFGGGVYVEFPSVKIGNATIENNLINGKNDGTGEGYGLYLDKTKAYFVSSPKIKDSIFTNMKLYDSLFIKGPIGEGASPFRIEKTVLSSELRVSNKVASKNTSNVTDYEAGLFICPEQNLVGRGVQKDIVWAQGKAIKPNYSEITFNEITYEDPAPNPISVKVDNTGQLPTGEMDIDLSTVARDYFNVSPSSMSLEKGESKYFTVQPKSNLAPGKYTGTVYIKNDVLKGYKVTLSYNVKHLYKVGLTVDDPNFDTITYEDPNPADKVVTINNLGSIATGDLDLTLEGTSPEAFELSNDTISLAKGGKKTFTVKPVANLRPGTYEAKVAVENDDVPKQTVDVKFTVEDLYRISLNKNKAEFGSIIYGQNPPSWIEIQVENTGTIKTGNLSLELDNEEAFTLENTTINLDPKGKATIKVKPKSNQLDPNIYAGIISIGNDNVPKQQVELSYTVKDLYAINIDESEYEFDPIVYSAAQPQAKELKVTNIGTTKSGIMDVKLKGTSPEAFTLSEETMSLDKDEEKTFTIQPKDKLEPGTYKAQVEVGSTKVAKKTVDVKFKVIDLFSIKTDKKSVDFGEITHGQTQPQGQSVKVENLGTTNTGDMTITLDGHKAAFNLDKTTMNIEKGGYAYFKVTPANKLDPGTYEATVSVGNDNTKYEDVSVKFTVNERYEISLNETEANFGDIYYGAEQPKAKSILVKNEGTIGTGNMLLNLEGDNPNAFKLSDSSLDIDKGSQKEFSIELMPDLKPGVYNATVTIGNDNVPAKTVNVSFTVNDTYGISIDKKNIYFGNTDFGLEPPLAREITVTNIGTASTGDIVISLDEEGQDAFTLSKSTLNIASMNDTDSFNVRPKEYLPPGTYISTLTIGNDAVGKNEVELYYSVGGTNEPPSVIKISPSGNNAETKGVVEVIFSEAMNVNEGVVKINGKEYTENGKWSGENAIYSVPYTDLEYDTLYKVSLQGFKNAKQTAYDSTKTFEFTTRPEKTARVTFNGNGGSSLVPYKDIYVNRPIQELPSAARTGYTFTGWYTAPIGGTKVNVSFETDINVTLYAGWTANSYTLSYNANGGKVSVGSNVVVFGNVYGALPTPTKKNNKFKGWFTAPSGGVQVTSGTVYSAAENTTLYARWEAAKKVTFNANKGKISKKKTKVVYKYSKSKIGKLPKATRKGYKFKGWYTKKKGGKKIKSSTKITKNVKYYAQWKKK